MFRGKAWRGKTTGSARALGALPSLAPLTISIDTEIPHVKFIFHNRPTYLDSTYIARFLCTALIEQQFFGRERY